MVSDKDRTRAKNARTEAAKLRFIKRAIDFAEMITGKDGKRHDLNAFSFRVIRVSSMMTGNTNTVEIWYHPQDEYQEGLIPRLEGWWQFNTEKCKLDKFDPNEEWQQALIKAIGSWKKASRPAVPIKRVLTKYEQEMRELHLAERERRLAKRLAKQQQV